MAAIHLVLAVNVGHLLSWSHLLSWCYPALERHLVLHLVLVHLRIGVVAVALGLQMGMRIYRLHEICPQRVHVGGIVHEIEDELWVFLVDAAVLEEVSNLCILHSHVD